MGRDQERATALDIDGLRDVLVSVAVINKLVTKATLFGSNDSRKKVHNVRRSMAAGC